MRWGALRHGDAAIARDFSADLGDRTGAVLAKGDSDGAREISRIHLHGRGLLGSRMDPAAAGFHVLLRQATLRPLAGRPCRADPRAPACRPRLPGQARAHPISTAGDYNPLLQTCMRWFVGGAPGYWLRADDGRLAEKLATPVAFDPGSLIGAAAIFST